MTAYLTTNSKSGAIRRWRSISVGEIPAIPKQQDLENTIFLDSAIPEKNGKIVLSTVEEIDEEPIPAMVKNQRHIEKLEFKNDSALIIDTTPENEQDRAEITTRVQDLKFYSKSNSSSISCDLTSTTISRSASSATLSSVADMTFKNNSREPALLAPEIEEQGVLKILQALTAEERQAIPDCNMPLRHLRAEKGDVAKAIHKCKSTLAWRKSFGVDDIISCFNKNDSTNTSQAKLATQEELRAILLKENETAKVYVRGRDKNGRSIMYMRPSRENSTDIENNMRNLVYHLERAVVSTSTNTNGALEKINIVIDYKGFTLSKAPPMKATMCTLEILQSHYCERLHRAYMCNTPAIFNVFWRMVKHLIDPNTREKIVFCSAPEARDLVLKEQPDLSQLEKCAFGLLRTEDFNPREYLEEIPFNQSY